ncbi:Uma2 family endonuclease [Streptomyces alkaliphilus]|uniref:Uma2 family endonuclease n=1 Tax=Streptomyces alkaliphilus TaxID=1472722 RepID=UPI0034D1D7CF
MARNADRSTDMTIAPEQAPAPERTEDRPSPPPARAVTGLIDLAEVVFRELPGHRPEILEGRLIVNPPPDGHHADSLTGLTLALAELHRGETKVRQGIGLWLPTGDEDYVIPDLSVVDADALDHVVAYNCFDPRVFRMVVEITSGNHVNDTVTKPPLYARAGVPVYLIGNRREEEVVLLTDPREDGYRTRSVHRPGETLVLPESIGAKIEIDVDTLLPR